MVHLLEILDLNTWDLLASSKLKKLEEWSQSFSCKYKITLLWRPCPHLGGQERLWGYVTSQPPRLTEEKLESINVFEIALMNRLCGKTTHCCPSKRFWEIKGLPALIAGLSFSCILLLRALVFLDSYLWNQDIPISDVLRVFCPEGDWSDLIYP